MVGSWKLCMIQCFAKISLHKTWAVKIFRIARYLDFLILTLSINNFLYPQTSYSQSGVLLSEGIQKQRYFQWILSQVWKVSIKILSRLWILKSLLNELKTFNGKIFTAQLQYSSWECLVTLHTSSQWQLIDNRITPLERVTN